MAERTNRRVRLRTWFTGWLVLASGVGCTPLDDVLAVVFEGRSMRAQPSIGAYENPRLPPENSVPFAAGNFPQAPGAVNTGQPEMAEVPAPPPATWFLTQPPEVMEMENPVEATDASLARGEVMFNRSCSPCHGTSGAGDGPVTQAGMVSFSLLTPQVQEFPDGYLYTIIRTGRGVMPAYRHQITHYDRWHIVNYLRQLQAESAGPTDDAETPDQAEEQ